jgi:hypothetical protein
MKDLNLPDNCQGNNPDFPWNEPEDPICPDCGDGMTMVLDELHCDNEDCDYFEAPPEHEPEDY